MQHQYNVALIIIIIINGSILWGHSGPLCHVLSLSSSSSWTLMRRWRHLVNGRAAARSGEWAQHFSNASCYYYLSILKVQEHSN